MVPTTDETQLMKIILGIINVCGPMGLKLRDLESEFRVFCGFDLPYRELGYDDLKSWVLTLPNIYLLKDDNNEETLFQYSEKSNHVRQLIFKQKSFQDKKIYNSRPQNRNYGWRNERNLEKKYSKHNSSHIHQSINTVSINDTDRFHEFNKLESMLPLFYKHQGLGDDFLLDIADTKFGYYVPEEECGLCSSNLTISELTEKVRNTQYLAPRVVVMIGLTDLLMHKNVNDMIVDLQELVKELKDRNTRITLVTLIPTPKMMNLSSRYFTRMKIFNDAIKDYSYSVKLKCNIIDMYSIFREEESKFNRNQDRLTKITKTDKYKVFSDYGRKIFISNLKSCLVEQLMAGH
ncbi:unnamed protein product [Phyllotreta striolata]|uniref:HTH OST-type domain-containing protein n=1 Tax=Phyllotreta striolata TaxID=444603 RepID=A0A9N9TC03_PHYSR|nr:unnamed protein product [Phyllotreta striolata]